VLPPTIVTTDTEPSIISNSDSLSPLPRSSPVTIGYPQTFPSRGTTNAFRRGDGAGIRQ